MSLTPAAQAPVVRKVEPPNWWAGHSINPVRLLVRGERLAGARAKLASLGPDAHERRVADRLQDQGPFHVQPILLELAGVLHRLADHGACVPWEALAAIASVADVSLVSRTAGAPHAARLDARSGELRLFERLTRDTLATIAMRFDSTQTRGTMLGAAFGSGSAVSFPFGKNLARDPDPVTVPASMARRKSPRAAVRSRSARASPAASQPASPRR